MYKTARPCGLFSACDSWDAPAFILGYAFLLDGGNAMPDDPTPALLYRMNQNIMALGSAIDEIGNWIDQRGSTEASNRISAHLQVLEDNADAIAELMADLMARWKPEEEIDPED
ncbi:hypothetical protein [Pseudomonas sp. LB3P58]